MNLKLITIVLLTVLVLVGYGANNAKKSGKANNKKNARVEFVNKEAERKVDVIVGGKLFTTYCWPENVTKPVLYPVNTSAGTEITRGWPLNPRQEERVDHPHQVGICFTYGMVNGLDFWGNSTAIPADNYSQKELKVINI